MRWPRASPRIGCLLTIKPYELEQAFWRSHETRRILLITDTVACVLAFLVAFLSLYRISATAPHLSPFSIYLGPSNILFNLGALAVVYHVSAALPVLAMIIWPRFYYNHRYALCLVNRLLRLIVSTLQLMFAQGVEHFYKAVSTRTLDETPNKALLVHVLHPAAFWMMQSSFITPFSWACVAQLVNTVAVSRYYSSMLPCLVESVLLKPNKLHTAQFQEEAVHGCELLQAVASFARMALGDPTFMLTQDICVGLKAVQILQLFATIVCLLLLPLGFMYSMERLLKRRFLEALQLPEDAAAADTAAVSSSSMADAAVQHSSASIDSSRGRATIVSTGTLRHRRHVVTPTALNSVNSIVMHSASSVVEPVAIAASSAGASCSRDNEQHSTPRTADAGTCQNGPETIDNFQSALLQHLGCILLLLPVTWLLCEFFVDEVFGLKCARKHEA